METKHVMLGFVLLIALSATLTMLEARKTGQATHQQLIHRDYMIRRPTFDPCSSVKCIMNTNAIQIGEDLAGNTICECPDGEQYIVDTRRRY
ncbi:hypothetical protein GF358_04205 [Candidatus Woesearchaeota archaeon]|nr:hypothetical protein [Candidatus Woesearchaeota archaeon]